MAISFNPFREAAFERVQFIMYETRFGWVTRLIHFNGASLFFVALYFHIFKAIRFIRFRLKYTWMRGLTLFILVIGAAFLGYVIVWAQMRFWACNVITNLIRVIPIIGRNLIIWVWAGYRVNNATLGVFFVLHFLLPFVILGLVVVHVLFLHQTGSTSTLLTHRRVDKLPFNPYFTVKDSYNVFYWVGFIRLTLLFPWILGDSEIFIEANPTSSPVHIVPEWYFLYVYAILRRIPNKVLGVIALVLRFVVFYLIPMSYHYRNSLDTLYINLFWWFIGRCVVLTWIGRQRVELPFTLVGVVFTCLFFVIMFIMFMRVKLSQLLFYYLE